MGFDLHVHSNRSDGAYSPAEAAKIAHDAGLEGFALTDHDTYEGFGEAESAGRSLGIEVLCGVEMSTTRAGASVHILGYFFDRDHPRFRRELRLLRDDRVERALAMIARLNELGVAVTFERVREIAQGQSIGRPHIAQAMVELGAVPSTTAAFTAEWIANRGRAYVERHALTPVQAVEIIREAGGTAVVAHPIWLETDHPDPTPAIEEMAESGLGGIEVNHPDHDPAARERFAVLAKRLDLIATGSSDWHGNEHGGEIGSNTTDRDTLERLRDRARSK